jgi:hypothetical protein
LVELTTEIASDEYSLEVLQELLDGNVAGERGGHERYPRLGQLVSYHTESVLGGVILSALSDFVPSRLMVDGPSRPSGRSGTPATKVKLMRIALYGQLR